MQHIAIMNKSWKLIPKILSKEKTIESRWYKTKRIPWNKIQTNDIVYFKDSGSLITAKAIVDKVLQFEINNLEQLQEIINNYSKEICFSNPNKAFEWTKDKKYCILIFLNNPETITPFEINKSGFGNACAWLSIDDISKIMI